MISLECKTDHINFVFKILQDFCTDLVLKPIKSRCLGLAYEVNHGLISHWAHSPPLLPTAILFLFLRTYNALSNHRHFHIEFPLSGKNVIAPPPIKLTYHLRHTNCTIFLSNLCPTLPAKPSSLFRAQFKSTFFLETFSKTQES